METEIFKSGEIVGMFAIAMALIELIKFLVNKYSRNGGLEGKLDKISGNHLSHIYGEMQHQTNQHERQIYQHEEQTKILTKIATILEERR
jgi:hypothetical protein